MLAILYLNREATEWRVFGCSSEIFFSSNVWFAHGSKMVQSAYRKSKVSTMTSQQTTKQLPLQKALIWQTISPSLEPKKMVQ